MICQKFLERQLFELFSDVWFKDAQPNGLQVPREGTISSIVGGVTASLALIEAAIAKNADAILVHHGWFWSKESRTLEPYQRRRHQRLLEGNIALFAYHLPLDFHGQLGNNVQWAKQMDWEIEKALELGEDRKEKVGLIGRVGENEITPQTFAAQLSARLRRKPLWLSGPNAPTAIKKIAWCSGAGQAFVNQAAAAGVQAYISGEVSEQTFHFVQENPIHFFCAGHHATERYGVQALGAWIAKRWGCSFEFVEIPNPI